MPGGRDRSRDPGNDLIREGIMGRIGGAVQHWLNGGTITPEQQERYNSYADRRDIRVRSRAVARMDREMDREIARKGRQ